MFVSHRFVCMYAVRLVRGFAIGHRSRRFTSSLINACERMYRIEATGQQKCVSFPSPATLSILLYLTVACEFCGLHVLGTVGS